MLVNGPLGQGQACLSAHASRTCASVRTCGQGRPWPALTRAEKALQVVNSQVPSTFVKDSPQIDCATRSATRSATPAQHPRSDATRCYSPSLRFRKHCAPSRAPHVSVALGGCRSPPVSHPPPFCVAWLAVGPLRVPYRELDKCNGDFPRSARLCVLQPPAGGSESRNP